MALMRDAAHGPAMTVISRRSTLALSAGAFASKIAGAGQPRPVVVELFTSQGCSSCPPADAFFAELKSTEGVLALSYHVDYWDYLGWKDTLGSAQCSQRQYDYAKARGDGNVYTPQMVIDGGAHVVGSQRAAVIEAVRKAEAGESAPTMRLEPHGHKILIKIDESAAASDAMVWLMTVSPKIAVQIKRGENSGKDIAYHNVVRQLVPAGMWSGKSTSLTLPKDAVMTPGVEACVALLQEGKAGRILGAVSWGGI